MRPKTTIAALPCTATLAACATKGDDIAAAYVSPSMFQSMNCQQMGEEAHRLSPRASQAIETRNRKADNDAAATAISMILFWPAAFMIRGDGESAAEVSRLKGEMQTIEPANISRHCGLSFAS